MAKRVDCVSILRAGTSSQGLLERDPTRCWRGPGGEGGREGASAREGAGASAAEIDRYSGVPGREGRPVEEGDRGSRLSSSGSSPLFSLWSAAHAVNP